MTITLNHMTKQSSHISHDCPTESHDQTKLAHTIGKEKIKQMARKIYIECEVHYDGADGILKTEVPLCNTEWYTVVTASIRFLGGSRFLTSSQQSYTQHIIANVLYLWLCPSMVQRIRMLMINWARVGNKLIEAMSILCIEVSFCYKQSQHFCAKP